MGKKKSGASQEGEGFQVVKGKKDNAGPKQQSTGPKKEGAPKKAPKKAAPRYDDEEERFKNPNKFTTVLTKKAEKKLKAQAAAEAAEQTPTDLVTREYPLHKDQVRPALAKKDQIEDESNAKMAHKEAQYPGNPSTMVLTGTTVAVLKAEQLIAKALKEVKHEEALPTSKYGDAMVGVLIGPKGQTLEKIRELAPNAKVVLPEEGGHYVSIYGQPADVQKIAAAIRGLSGSKIEANQVQITSSDDVEMVRKVPLDRNGKPMHWILIGKGGCNVRRIRDESGAELVVPPPNSYSDEYILRGSLEACEKASQIIFEILAETLEGPSRTQLETAEEPKAAPAQPAQRRDPLVVPSASGAPTCVAPRLQRKIQESRGGASSQPSAQPVAVVPRAPPKPLEVVDLGPPTLIDIPLPVSAHSAKVKQRIKELVAECNVKVAFDGNNSLRLDGYQHRCLIAERAVMKLMGITKAEVAIPKSRQGDPMIGVVIGPAGSTINRIRLESGNAFVLLPDDGCGLAPDSVTIFGTPAEVDRAVDVVRSTLQITEEARRTAVESTNLAVMEVEGEVPRDRQGNALVSVLIGTGGKNIKWIREESEGVEIDIPKKREQGAIVKYKLRGTEEQIKAAQRCIRMLYEDSDQQYFVGQPQDNVLPPNPYAGCTVIGGH